jgi:hypothetical protein
VARSFHRPSTAWPSYESLYSATARFIDVEYSLTVMGCVDAPDTQRYSRLVDLATLRSDRTVGLSFRDLLAAVRLDISAAVLVVADHRRSFAVPVCDALEVEGGVPHFVRQGLLSLGSAAEGSVFVGALLLLRWCCVWCVAQSG